MPRKSEKPRKGFLHFSVDCRLLFELGEQLVARKSVALAEVVKNAYDADATEVTVRLENTASPKGRIIVQDNGIGMTFQQIQDTWMRIATDAKQKRPLSEKYRRPRAGAKGIGRFATRRLSRSLSMNSIGCRPDSRKEETTILFQWDKFSPGKDIDEIPNHFRVTPAISSAPLGTTLSLDGLREKWAKEDVEELERDLLSLVSPFPGHDHNHKGRDPGFTFRIEAPEFPELTGELSEKFFKSAWGTLDGSISSKGNARYRLRVRNTKTRSFQSEGRFNNLGRARLRLHFFVYRSKFFKSLPFSVGQAKEFARTQSGVRIYLDKFRVFPYGDPGDDWLDLDADRGRRLTGLDRELTKTARRIRRPMLLVPGNNQLFGAVIISRRANPQIAVNISRERLLENDAFLELKRFVRLGIDWMTVLYARYLQTEEAKAAGEEPVSPMSHLQVVRDEIERAEDLERSTKARILQALDLARSDYEAEERERISELSMVRVLATVGTTVVIFDHELRAIIDALEGLYTDLRDFTKNVPDINRPDYQELLKQLKRWVNSVEQQGSQIGLLLGAESRQRKKDFVLKQVVDELASPFTRYMEELGIEFENHVPATLRTPPMFRCELQSILLNLHTNALKSVKRKPQRRIAVFAKSTKKHLRILFCDTGTGISIAFRREAFKPFVTTSEPDPVLGAGTGLGLKIVHDLVDIYGGTATFVDCKEPWKACVEVTLPYS